MTFSKPWVLFDFKQGVATNEWVIVDDVVMGGVSSGKIRINDEGHGVFSGKVSLENNGGFSSIFHPVKTADISAFENIVLKIKGDGKRYQFRIKENAEDYFSYIQYFETNGDWQELKLPFKEFYPSFRGRKLNQPNYQGEQIEEIRFLIANKKNEDFSLLIDRISLE